MGETGTDQLMLHPKACPGCTGDLSLIEDVGNTYFLCVQCGYITYQFQPAIPQASATLTPSS